MQLKRHYALASSLLHVFDMRGSRRSPACSGCNGESMSTETKQDEILCSGLYETASVRIIILEALASQVSTFCVRSRDGWTESRPALSRSLHIYAIERLTVAMKSNYCTAICAMARRYEHQYMTEALPQHHTLQECTLAFRPSVPRRNDE